MHTVIFLQKNKPDGLFKTVDKFACSFYLKTFQLISEIRSPPTVCQATSLQAAVGYWLASYSAGVSQISSIQ
ncbi:hypothetical protein P8767_03125 [Peribacillus frigoritolerans]|nr:hypothetical protein [Peribacillus frigoritolerans]